MCIRDREGVIHPGETAAEGPFGDHTGYYNEVAEFPVFTVCLLYTSDAADERSSVDLGGRRIIKKKKRNNKTSMTHNTQHHMND